MMRELLVVSLLLLTDSVLMQTMPTAAKKTSAQEDAFQSLWDSIYNALTPDVSDGASGDADGDEVCLRTEDLSPSDWVQQFTGEMRTGQHSGAPKTAIIRIGTMGSGKSSAVDGFLNARNPGWDAGNMFQIVDLDRMVTSSKAYREKVCADNFINRALTPKQMGDAWWDGQVATDGYKTVDWVIDAASFQGLTFSVEQTGTYFCPLRKVARKLFKAGYEVVGASPYVPYFELKTRVAKRAEEEGRDVDTSSLINNMKALLPQLFDMMRYLDTFYILNNLVAKGAAPEVMVEQETDWTKYDDQLCSRRTINSDVITRIMQILVANEDKYVGQEEQNLFVIEKTFLESMLRADKVGKPCVFTP